jgi:hypothetical protein
MTNVEDGVRYLRVRFKDPRLSAYFKAKTAHSAAFLGAVTWTVVVVAPILG